MEGVEEVTLIKVARNGVILTLQDGRRLTVKPNDSPIAQRWKPASVLEVSETHEDRVFSLDVTLQDTSEHVRARWE